MSSTDDQATANLMDGPVPTGKTPGKRVFLSAWGRALEKVGRRHGGPPCGPTRGQRLQDANAESHEKSGDE